MSDSIRVVCRLRPLNKIELANDGYQCVKYQEKDVMIHVGDDNQYSFAFDRVFAPGTQQVTVYEEVAMPIIKSVVCGFNATIFAYGQTGGGKTWTMEGPNHHDQLRGLIPRTIDGLFFKIGECEKNLEFLIKCSYVEIYNEKLFDLLDRNKCPYLASKARLQIKQDRQRGIFIQNCTEICVSSAEQMLKMMDSGSLNRKVAFTGMNQRSSRSHSLFIIHLFQKDINKDCTKQSKLVFVDLAGSEKVSKTGVQGQQLQQAKNINKSLSSLGNVINALTSQKKQHIPYRDSKLTRILQQSLGGNSKTTLIINCSICSYNDKQTLSTLRFGYRAKSIKNKPKVNEEKSVKQLVLLLQNANRTIIELRGRIKGEDTFQKIEEEDERDLIINDLKVELEANKFQEQERRKEIELRVKQLIIELTHEKQENTKQSKLFSQFVNHLGTINKLIKRTYVDLEYCQNNIIMEQGGENKQTETIKTTLNNIEQYQKFYDQELKSIFEDILNRQKQDLQLKAQIQNHLLSPEKKKNKNALSQPALYAKQIILQEEKQNEMLQISCILQKASLQNTQSDKASQQSFTELQTMIESLQTKESQKQLIEQMSSNLKNLRKQNEQLIQECQKHQKQIEQLEIKLGQRYQERINDLQQRVHEYKKIINHKDQEFTKKIQQVQSYKTKMTEEKVCNEKLLKIIQSSSNMKVISDLQNKLQSLVSERQKIFNQLYGLRSELDYAEITIKQQDQHIDSLKKVMKQLSSPVKICSPTEIQKTYNTQIYGTQNPHIMHTVNGGKEAKRSALRKKTNPMTKKEPQHRAPQGKSTFLPFFTTFFK